MKERIDETRKALDTVFDLSDPISVTMEKTGGRFGKDKAGELLASINCRINKVRSTVDRDQQWAEHLCKMS